MLITDKKELAPYQAEYRIWQGIPTLERTPNGKTFCSFYSGNTKEWFGNFCALLESSDDGESWSEVIAVITEGDAVRICDPILWLDPLGRLWWIYDRMPDNAVYAYVCEHPDEELKFGERIYIGHDHLLQKPTVLSTGEWMFPIAVWDADVFSISRTFHTDRRCFLYKTVDNGKTFTKLGGVDGKGRHFDEHAVIERLDGSLQIFIRTQYGIGTGFSYDGGVTWTEGVDSGLGGPNSRFFIRRLRSGRLLLVNHYNFRGRNNLTAMLSEDDGKTWPHKLLLDGRDNVSYPDGVEADDGYIYITYDRERGSYKERAKDALASAREILLARFTEDDVIRGYPASPRSVLRHIINKLGPYAGDADALFADYADVGRGVYARQLAQLDDADKILEYVFRDYGTCCVTLGEDGRKALDDACKLLSDTASKNDICTRIAAVERMIELFRGSEADMFERKSVADKIVTEVCAYVGEHLGQASISLETLAADLNISKYYMWHVFKKRTGKTVTQYVQYRRLKEAKRLLVESHRSLTEIAILTGFADRNYFSKWFKRQEGVTPMQYRKYNRLS